MDNRNDVSKRYIRHCFETENKTASQAASQYENQDVPIQSIGLTSERAEEILVQHEPSGVKQKFIHFCFRHKNAIKRLPIIGKKAVVIKAEKLDKSIKKAVIDIEPYIPAHYAEFIHAVYKLLLGRAPDESGIAAYTAMAKNGASNGAIVYAVASSPEFGGRAVVMNLRNYRKQYKKYIRKCRIKKLPIIGRIAKLYSVSNQLAAFQDNYEYFNGRLTDAVFAANQKIDAATWAFSAEKDKMLYCIGLQSDLIKQLQERIDGLDKMIAEYDPRLSAITEQLDKMRGEGADTAAALAKELTAIHEESVKELFSQNSLCLDIKSELDSVKSKQESDYSRLLKIINEQTAGREAVSQLIDKADYTMQLITGLHEKADLNTSIATSSSKKLDELPEFINGNSVKSKTVISGFPGGVTSVYADDFVFGVPSEEWGLAAWLSLYGHFEYGSETLFEKLIKPGMTVLDVGANLGIYTLRALRAGCEVYSYEPTPSTYNILLNNIKANGFAETGRSHAFNLAVSDKEGTAEFCVIDGICGQSNSFYSSDNIDIKEKIQVRTAVLDELLSDVPKIDFIKMDIEGAEYAALIGMKKLLSKNPNVKILMEFAPCHMVRANVKPEAMLELIKELGFNYYSIDERTGELCDTNDQTLLECSSENLLLTKDKIEL